MIERCPFLTSNHPYGCVWSKYQRRSPDPRTPLSRRSPRAWERRDIPASRGSSWERDMFHGIRLLFCTFKEGTVIRGDIGAGEKNILLVAGSCGKKCWSPE